MLTKTRAELAALVLANAISACGTAMTFLAVPWFVLHTTGSAVQTGLVATAETAGLVLSSAMSGPLIDRFGARRSGITADVVAFAAVAVIPVLHHLGLLALWHIVALALLLGLSRAPGDASRVTLLPSIVSRSSTPMERAASAYEGATRGARMLGGPLAGVLIVWLGVPPVLVVDALTFLLCAALVRFCVRPDETRERPTGRYLAELGEGLRTLRGDRLVLVFVIMTMVTNLLDAALVVVILPVYASEVLHSSVALGLLVGLPAGGALAGATLFGWLGPRLPRWQTFAICYLLMGCPRFFVLLAEPGLPVLIVTMFAAGIAGGAINPIMTTVEYQRIPEDKRGRVLGAGAAGAMLGMPVGTAAAGVLVTTAGLHGTIALLGTIYLAATLTVFVFPVWREMNAAEQAAVTSGTPSDQPH
ncbi:Predicted arabinose efflux permease, MFS family [Lentzea xinjiangensis]|uniref:Predicted arabinose efflux permease, MFS family n=1 Tax=Lentzea xinjiangensis TaxID=402600 RepID=A0A1H9SZ40_9PSEU|nr:MFS transporter [Lentzea xinjiangensis]SER90290.1 Predicted arabinose efflux permease, MFS family [Lentzea xinjiangensis]